MLVICIWGSRQKRRLHPEGVTMSSISPSLARCRKEFKKLVEASPIPKVKIVGEDTESNGKWKCLSLMTDSQIIGPYRAIQLSRYERSEGTLIKDANARKMAELFLRINSKRAPKLIEETEEKNDALALEKHDLDIQKLQINSDDSFKFVNIDLAVEPYELESEKDWVNTIVKLQRANEANLLVMTIPNGVRDAESILKYQIRAFQANLQLKHPMYVAGYVPDLSQKENKKLVDAYFQAGINTFIVDFRGRNKKLNDGGVAYLIAKAKMRATPTFIHGLQVKNSKKATPTDIIQDLALPYYGIQSITNLRRSPYIPNKPEDEEENDDEDNLSWLRLRCPHGYFIPKLEEIEHKSFSCPECTLDSIIDAYHSEAENLVKKEQIIHNATVSQMEMANLFTMIKEGSITEYLEGKDGFKIIEPVWELFMKKVRKAQKNTSRQTSIFEV